MNLIKKSAALFGSTVVIAGCLIAGTTAAAHAENPPCPAGTSVSGIVDHADDGTVWTSAKVCFVPEGDWFYYQDTHAETPTNMAGGMYYVANDGISHDHDNENLWDTNGAVNGWKSLNTDESEGSLVEFRACLRQADGSGVWGCGAWKQGWA